MEKLDVMNVFIDKNGSFGNPVGLYLDLNNALSVADRQKIATESGYSEVVFVNSLEKPNISIFSPQNEIAFAGHAILGALKYISQLGDSSPEYIHCMGNRINCRQEGDLFYVIASSSIFPPWNLVKLASVELVENFSFLEASKLQHTFVWAWIDEKQGIVRARTFASDWDIPEDEANGSGSMKLTLEIGKKLRIIHGKGSEIYVNPLSDESVELGGRVSSLILDN